MYGALMAHINLRPLEKSSMMKGFRGPIKTTNLSLETVSKFHELSYNLLSHSSVTSGFSEISKSNESQTYLVAKINSSGIKGTD